jgi:hypothetical protein
LGIKFRVVEVDTVMGMVRISKEAHTQNKSKYQKKLKLK